MKNAKIGIFEDSELIQTTLGFILSNDEHHVALQVHTIPEAEQAINDLSGDALDIAIVDGNLSPGAIDCREGAYITQLLHERFSKIVVISFSGMKDIEGADIQYGKERNMSGLLDIIRKI